MHTQALERRQREEQPVITAIADLLLSFVRPPTFLHPPRPAAGSPGRAFARLFPQATRASAYVTYGSNLSRMQAEVQRLLATNPDLVAFLEVGHCPPR